MWRQVLRFSMGYQRRDEIGNKKMKNNMSTTNPLFEAIFWDICLGDFMEHREALATILPAGLNAVAGKAPRQFERLCEQFFADHVKRWQRYEDYLTYWGRSLPVENEEEDEWPDYKEMGELLAHRIVMAYMNAEKHQKHLASVDLFPYWRLRVIADGRTPPECLAEAQASRHYTDPYWQAKQLPCERLDCRCSISSSAHPD